ncbi:LPS assembly lipoprotein LptE [Parasalinivibrio latis]|uniref:LPS-assembly lipoprotein LptE n=1 Tax=Parasalinivibrio latis TaxID=2952610 RepID=UPI003DA62F2A
MKAIKLMLRSLLVAVAVLATASCGFQLRGSYNLPDEIQNLSLTSFDQYSQLTRKMYEVLRLHDIKIVPPGSTVANLNLTGESWGERTLSLYQNSRVAEQEFNYVASYRVTIPEKGSYTFRATVSRNFLDNPLTALAKSVEQEMLVEEMRNEAAQQIVRQLARLNADIEDFEANKAAEEALKEQPVTDGSPKIEVKTRTPDAKKATDAQGDNKETP